MEPSLDFDLLELPLFNDDDRAFAADLDARAADHSWPDPEIDDAAALRSALATLAEWGTLKHTVSEPWRLTTNVLARETLAYHSGIADLAYVMQILGGVPVMLMGAPELKADVLPKVVSGEIPTAFAITEPEAGSDLSMMTSTATRAGDDYILRGVKHLVSNVGVASHFSLFARTSEGPKGVSAFWVPVDATGMSIELQRPTSPHPLGILKMDGVRIPATSRLGEEGDGMKLGLMTLERCRTTVAAAACGFARRALDEALNHANSRRMFGGTLASQPLAQAMIAEMQARLDESRMAVYRAAFEFDRGAPRITRLASQAKWRATENAQWVIDQAVQLAGGLGVLHGSIFERLYREIRPLRIYEGATEVQKLVIGRGVVSSQ